MSHQDLIQQVRQYYEGKLADHGPTARGVDWNSEESQLLRFRELARLFAADRDADVLDYGCGYGAMAAYLRQNGHSGPYVGYDVSERMIESARERYGGLPRSRFTADGAALEPAGYTVASGIFNVKQSATAEEWRAYMFQTIDDLRRLSTRGFAFNALTSYADAERKREDLYYADPLELFDHCKRHVSRFVSLLHDTPLYEFTLIVRL